jgi:hypothetical protein
MRAARAVATNQLARLLPTIYISVTGETGRGAEESNPQAVADYFRSCVDEYLLKLGIDRTSAEAYLRGKHLLEYGPGDTPAVAILFVALGAESVTCVDRFPLMRLQRFSQQVLAHILAGLPDRARTRAESCFNIPGQIESGLSPHRIRYVIGRKGLLAEQARMTLVISRAVLEHVDALDLTFKDMRDAMTDDAVALHLVDLRSHGLHRRNPLDFLTWPDWLWSLMYSAKGVPNRLRPDAYKRAIRGAGLEIVAMEPTACARKEDIDEVKPYLATQFRDLGDDDLSWMGFWLVCRRSDSASRLEKEGIQS